MMLSMRLPGQCIQKRDVDHVGVLPAAPAAARLRCVNLKRNGRHRFYEILASRSTNHLVQFLTGTTNPA